MATKVKLIADGVITPDQITLTTASSGTNTTAPATTAFVQQEISALVDSSPAALNTLNELAAALGDDANFSTTVTNSIATKLPLAGGTLTGNLTVGTSSNSLGTTAGNQLTPLTLRSDTANNDSLLFTTERRADGTNWTTAAHRIQRKVDATKMGYIQFGSSAADTVTFGQGNTERMRIDGDGKLGLGTDSPDTIMEIKGADPVLTIRDNSTGISNANATLRLAESGGSDTLGAYFDVSMEEQALTFSHSSDGGASSEQMRFDGVNGRLGIKTTSPQAGIDVESSAKGIFTSGNVYPFPTGNAYIKVKGTNAEHNWIGITGGYEQSSGSANLILQSNFRLIGEQAGNYIGSEAQSVTTADITFGKLVGGSSTSTNATKSEFMRIDSSGKVGIGTTSPSGEFHVDSALAPCDIHFTTGSSGGTGYDVNLNMTGGANNAEMNLNMGIAGDADREQIKTYQSTMMFKTNNTERMRIDSSGSLIIGKTNTTTNNTAGIYMIASGAIVATRNGDVSALFNRTGSDGQIVLFRKDNATVGLIGTEGTDLTIGSGGAGFQFLESENKIRPFNVSTNSASNGVVDLGRANAKFKDLYLSGAIKMDSDLDDYEEGTFTPLFYGGSSGTAENSSSGYYTKIGRLVTVQVDVYNKTFGTYSGDLRMTLPFTAHTRPASGGDVYFYPNSAWDGVSNFVGFTPRAYNTAYLTFGLITNDSDRQTNISSSNTSTSGASGIFLRFSFTYTTDS